MSNRSLYKGIITCFLGGLLFALVEFVLNAHLNSLSSDYFIFFLEDFLIYLPFAGCGGLILGGCLAVLFSFTGRSKEQLAEVCLFATTFLTVILLGYMFYVGILKRNNLPEIILAVLVFISSWLILRRLTHFASQKGNFWLFFICMTSGMSLLLLVVMKWQLIDYLLHSNRLIDAGVLWLVFLALYLVSYLIAWLGRRFLWATIGLMAIGLLIHILLVSKKESVSKLKLSASLPRVERPNILIILADTLRVDRLGCYGSPYPTSPFIDSLAAGGVLYENYINQSHWSLPSHASLFTGLYSSQHQASLGNPILDEQIVTLAQVLKAVGYQTADFCTNPWLNKDNGMLRGFDHAYSGERYSYFLFFKKRIMKIRWLASLLKQHKKLPDFRGIIKHLHKWFQWRYKKDEPLFMFINLLPPHFNYSPPEPFRSEFAKQRLKEVDEKKMVLMSNFHYPMSGMEKLAQETLRDNDLLETLNALYDGEVAYTDALVKEIITEFDQRNLLKDTLVIFTSDHGDYIGEHNLFGHENSLYETLIHVPLIINYPRLFPQGKRINTPVQQIDVFPTILGLLGIDKTGLTPEGLRYHGIDLRKPELVAKSRILVSETDYKFTDWQSNLGLTKTVKWAWCFARRWPVQIKSARYNNYKYLRYNDGYEELFDLAKDPGEEVNLASKQLDLLAKMRQRLEEFKRSIKTIKPGKQGSYKNFSKETQEQLRALGYIQ